MNTYRELIVWQKSMDLVKKVYELTSLFPKEEKYGLISQIQRSAVSIPSNISEGAGRHSNKDFRNFLGMVNGSLNELSTQLELANRIGYLKNNALKEVFNLINETQKINYTLIRKFSND